MNMRNEDQIEAMEEMAEEEEAPKIVVPQYRYSSMLPIIVFSYVGVLIRLGLALLGNNQAPINAALWANFVGCFAMGFIVQQKKRIQHYFVQLYTGLTTGLCGSLTTFSGIMYHSCVALFGPSSNYTYPISNYSTLMISVFAASFAGFIVGRHLSKVLLPPVPELRKIDLLWRPIRIWFFPTVIILSILSLAILASLIPVGHYTYFIYSVIFAPFGSLTRYVLSLTFNKNPNFPLGTWLANILGSCVYLGMIAITAYVQFTSTLMKQIILGIILGYSGCLTTVSTFMLELTMVTKHKYVYIYFLASLIPVQIVYIVLGDIYSRLCS